MSRKVQVHLLPDLIPEGAVRGQTAVIIDVLRASSTIVTALDNGAAAVIPCGEPADALRMRQLSPGDSPLLGGERGGVRIEGFDLGNSPAEYSRSVVSGRRIVFTTTNGTRALLKCRAAGDIAIGCWLNLASLSAWLLARPGDVHVVCAGTDGVISGEDVMAAGALVQTLTEQLSAEPEFNDSAIIARDAALPLLKAASDSRQALADYFASTQGGRNLIRIGQQADLLLCAALNSSACVPHFDVRNGHLQGAACSL